MLHCNKGYVTICGFTRNNRSCNYFNVQMKHISQCKGFTRNNRNNKTYHSVIEKKNGTMYDFTCTKQKQ